MDLQQYREYFEAMPCYLTVQDRDFHIIDANRQFRRDVGDPAGRVAADEQRGGEGALARAGAKKLAGGTAQRGKLPIGHTVHRRRRISSRERAGAKDPPSAAA